MSALGVRVPALRVALFEKAAGAYRAGLERFPQDENLMVRLGQALDGARRFDEAETFYVQAIHSDPNLGVLYAYYSSHLKLTGQGDAAKKSLDKARQLRVSKAHTLGMDEVRSILENAPEKSKGDVE